MTRLSAYTTNLATVHKLRDELLLLRTTVVRDRPLEDDSVLIDLYADGTDNLLERADGMLAAAKTGLEAVRQKTGDERASQALIQCQETFNDLRLKFSFDLFAHDRLCDLESLGRERGGEWLAWTYSVVEALDRCHRTLFEVNDALFVCWQEHLEQQGWMSISVQATNVGQQLRSPAGYNHASAD